MFTGNNENNAYKIQWFEARNKVLTELPSPINTHPRERERERERKRGRERERQIEKKN